MSKTLDVDNRERDVIYIDAREFNKKSGTSRGDGFIEYFDGFKKSNKKFAKNFRKYDESNIVTNKNLPVGDFIHNDVCIEVKEKRTDDLFDSIRGRRLATQSHELFQLRDKSLYQNPFRDCRILVMTDGNDFEHISNSPDIYKGLLNFAGETPVNYVNYTNNYTYGNPYEHLADSICHLFGMNGDQIGRQSHVSMVKTTNPAMTCLLSLNTLNSSECKRICDGEHLNSWHQVMNILKNPDTGKEDYVRAYNLFLNYTTEKKAISTLCKMTGKLPYELNMG